MWLHCLFQSQVIQLHPRLSVLATFSMSLCCAVWFWFVMCYFEVCYWHFVECSWSIWNKSSYIFTICTAILYSTARAVCASEYSPCTRFGMYWFHWWLLKVCSKWNVFCMRYGTGELAVAGAVEWVENMWIKWDWLKIFSSFKVHIHVHPLFPYPPISILFHSSSPLFMALFLI